MDATTNLDEGFSDMDIQLAADLASFAGIGGGFLDTIGLASDDFTADSQGLSLETEMPNASLCQADIFQSPPFSGHYPLRDLVQDGVRFNAYDDPYHALGHMPNYNGITFLTPPVAMPRELQDLRNSFPLSVLPQGQAGLAFPLDSFSLTEQSTGDGSIGSGSTSILQNASPSSTPGLPSSPGMDEKTQADCTMDDRHGFEKEGDPFPCHLCSESFAAKKSLNRHFTVWHREYARRIGLRVDKIPCPVRGCKKSYTRYDNARRHVKDKHGSLRP